VFFRVFRGQYLPLNHAAVSKNPSSIVKGGTHPNSRLIFELSTVNLFTGFSKPINDQIDLTTQIRQQPKPDNHIKGTPCSA